MSKRENAILDKTCSYEVVEMPITAVFFGEENGAVVFCEKGDSIEAGHFVCMHFRPQRLVERGDKGGTKSLKKLGIKGSTPAF